MYYRMSENAKPVGPNHPVGQRTRRRSLQLVDMRATRYDERDKQTSDADFGGVTSVTPVSPAVPLCFRRSLYMSGIAPNLHAAARSAYRNLYRASASTFAGECLRNGTETRPLN